MHDPQVAAKFAVEWEQIAELAFAPSGTPVPAREFRFRDLGGMPPLTWVRVGLISAGPQPLAGAASSGTARAVSAHVVYTRIFSP